jgi:hypothetical protein
MDAERQIDLLEAFFLPPTAVSDGRKESDRFLMSHALLVDDYLDRKTDFSTSAFE